MYRPPNNGVAGAGGGGFNPYGYYPPNLRFSGPGPGRPQYFQNPAFSSGPNLYHQNPSPPPPRFNPPPNPRETLERGESAAAKAHHELVAAGESVSAWKVSQSALASLKIDSWSSLGLQLHDVPTLHRLIVAEGKVNAFIHCFVGSRKITSLYDLEVAICKNDGIERFEELGLGPLIRHPLAVHFFSIPVDVDEVFKITSEDIISYLQNFIDKCRKKFTPLEFLDFVAEQKSVSAKEKLGVRIQSLGLHISYIRDAKRAEKAALSKHLELDKHHSHNERAYAEMVPLPDSVMFSGKNMFDRRFGFISKRIESFSSECDDFGGRHIRFDSSEDDDSEDDLKVCESQRSSHDKDSGQRASTCPYPSSTEEMIRLGLKVEKGEKVCSVSGTSMENGNKTSCSRKRKSDNRNGNDFLSNKLRKKDQAVVLEGEEKSLPDLALCRTKAPIQRYLLRPRSCRRPIISRLQFRNFRSIQSRISSGDMEKFVTTWKEACCEHPAAKVLVMMLDFYKIRARNKWKIEKLFLSQPFLGLLNVAVASIKYGIPDNLYDTFQTSDERGSINSIPANSNKMMTDVGPSVQEDAVVHTAKGINELSCSTSTGVSVDDIIKHICRYFDIICSEAGEGNLNLVKQHVSLRKLRSLEVWLTSQLCVKEFSSLGYGFFLQFLERHSSLLPTELQMFLNGDICGPPNVDVIMLQQQLRVLLSQFQSNLVDNAVITKLDTSFLLKKQFPLISLRIVGNEADECFSDLIKKQQEINNPRSVHFSLALLGTRWSPNSPICSHGPLAESAGVSADAACQDCVCRTASKKDAIQCLLKAPMLSDLLSWSHWDLVYAPSLGGLLEWLLNEACVQELSCIATCDGKLIRTDQSASVEGFLEALIQCSPFQAALKLLSLLSVYQGTSNAPIALLKCYAQRAFNVIVKNSNDRTEVNINVGNMESIVPFYGQVSSGKHAKFIERVSEGIPLSGKLSGVEKGVRIISRFILECLGHLPSEFRSFAADILVSGLQSVAKDAPLVILRESFQIDQRLMLHDIGLSLGFTEWIEDFHFFNLTNAADLSSSSVSPNGCPPQIASGIDLQRPQDVIEEPVAINHNSFSIVPSGSLTDGNDRSAEDDRRHHSAAFENEHCRESDGVCKQEIIEEVSKDGSDTSAKSEIEDAALVIEDIRREEFGVDPNLNQIESSLLKKQHARLGRALHCLSQELYSQDSHLLLELIQNADDNMYPDNVEPSVVFILQNTGIVILNNERGFTARNIRALCDIGNSTKKGSGAGYIGHKGIGFKSVFRVTNAPEIHSNGFHVKFDITQGEIGFILPTTISRSGVDMFRRFLADEDYLRDAALWNTCIILPFRSKLTEETSLSSIISMFSDLHPSLLLFLHRLRCIKVRNMLDDTLVVLRREIVADGIVKVSNGKEKMSWLVVKKKLQAGILRHDVQATEIALAFTLQESENGDYKPHLFQQPVFSFLPLRTYGLKFILQGDFVLPSSREEIDGDSAWNQWLLSEFPALFVSAEQSFCAIPCFEKNRGKAVTAFMSFVPLVGEVHGFFSHIPHTIISKLRVSSCLLLDGPDLEWALPCRILRGWDEHTRMLLPESLLRKHLGLGYLSRDILLSDALAKSLGVQEYGPKILVEVLASICQSDDAKLLGPIWLASWLKAIYSLLHAPSSGYSSIDTKLESDIFTRLREVSFIPLTDGSYSSLANGPIWLPCDAFTSGFEGHQSPKDFPYLYAKLRTVDPLLFSVTSTNAYSIEETRASDIIWVLRKIGVQELSAHEVITSHILVALCSQKHTNDERTLLVEYMSFIMLHSQHACTCCQTERTEIMSELRQKSSLLTNHGFKCPDAEPIHFGKEFGNPVDIGKLIGNEDVLWIEVDAEYLKHTSGLSESCGLLKWRDFLREIGVTDFVQVSSVRKNLPDVSYDVPPSMSPERELISRSTYSDWESPELVNLLSIFSFEGYRDQTIYLLEVLDKLWDECYSSKARNSILCKTMNDTEAISSFLKSIQESRWVASTKDDELHQPRDLYFDCEEVRSILGNMASYAVPQVTSKLLVKDIGLKTQVSLDDALAILHSWRMSKIPLMSSTAQMSKLYSFISDGVASTKSGITREFMLSPFIFIPTPCGYRHDDMVPGLFFPSEEVFWHDPSGCLDGAKKLFLTCTSMKTSCFPYKALAAVYPSLHDFFVDVCGVPEIPSVGSYLQILLQLSNVALPSQAAHLVFRVLLKWAEDLDSGLAKAEEINDLKGSLLKLENRVLPTCQDKWVSLHPSFGLFCWSDDEELKQQFKHFDGIDFLNFGEPITVEKEKTSVKVARLLQKLGVPPLSKVVSREAIYYGTVDNRDKASLINWVLPYAQRYLCKFYPNKYLNLKHLGIGKFSQLRVFVVEKLFYKYTLNGRDCSSKKRFDCSCLLQGNDLYVVQTSDWHSVFLELSRIFFDGSAELHLANFLHMVTTMAESGSTIEQTEFFIVDRQKVPKLSTGEPIWSLSSLYQLHETEDPQLACVPSADVERSTSACPRRRPGISSNWPPTDWKTAPNFLYSRANHLRRQPEEPLSRGSQKEPCKLTELASLTEGLPVPIEINGNWIIEEDSTATSTLMLEESTLMKDQQPKPVESLNSADRQMPSSLKPKSELADSLIVPSSDKGLTDFSAFPERMSFSLQSQDETQSRMTGRLGEMVAYKYFCDKFGSANVKWVNQDCETGLPYDVVTGNTEECREYVEVKATKSASKDWFAITTREWQFAAEKGEAFSIARVVLQDAKTAKITMLKNPIKLCQQSKLHLAVLMSKQL